MVQEILNTKCMKYCIMLIAVSLHLAGCSVQFVPKSDIVVIYTDKSNRKMLRRKRE